MKAFQASLFGIQDYRQWNGNRMFFPIIIYDIDDVKIMVIQHMPEDNFLGVKAFFTSL